MEKIINLIVDYLEEIMVVLAIISFVICGFATDLRAGFLCMAVSFIYADYRIAKFKKLMNRK